MRLPGPTLYKCAWMIQNKIPCTNECMMAKYHSTEMCMYAVEEAMRIYGGNAFCSEYPPNGTGGMPSSCFTAAAPTKCSVTIWEGSICKD